MKKIVILVIAIVIIFLLTLGILYYIDMNRMKNNKEVLFSTWGYTYAPPVNETNEMSNQNKLTIDDIKNMVAEKGSKLTWNDFSKYQSTEIGSGLYILLYEIDENYRLLIGGVPNEEPMYIKLEYLEDNEKSIDIRYDNIEEFLNKTK